MSARLLKKQPACNNRVDNPALVKHLLQPFVEAAIHENCLSGNVRGALGSQPHYCIGNFARFPQSLDWSVRCPGIENFFLGFSRIGRPRLGQLFQAIRSCITRPDVIYQNAVLAKLIRQAFYESHNGGANCVGQYEFGNRLLRGDRSNSDNAPPALALHVRDDFTREVNRAQEILFDRLLPLCNAGREESLCRRSAGVGHTDIGAAEFCDYAFHELMNCRRVGYIQRFTKHLRVVFPPDSNGRLLQRLRIACAHSHATTFSGKSFSRRPPNSLARSDNNCDTVLQTCFHRNWDYKGCSMQTTSNCRLLSSGGKR